MTPEQFRAVLDAHGGLSGTELLDTSKEQEILGEKTGKLIPPTRVRIKYVTKDGPITAYQQDDGTYQILDDPKGLVKAAGTDPNAPKPGTLPAQQNAATAAQNAQTNQQNADTRAAAEQARADYLRTQGDAIAFRNAVQAYTMQVNQSTLDRAQKQALLDAYKAEGERAQAERRLAIEQQNANTSAGQLGVSRGALGVTQQNADTSREQVIQTASSNAVDQTLKLLGQYTKVGPGFGTQFAAGLNTLSRGGGPMTVTPDAFMNPYVPDLDAIRHQAVTEAIDRLKTGGGMAPATAAAVGQTSVPGAVAPGMAPPAPSQAPAPGMGAAQLAPPILTGVPPAPPPVSQVPTPVYVGPPGFGPGNVQ